jgi:hypothetical protein
MVESAGVGGALGPAPLVHYLAPEIEGMLFAVDFAT